jgi:hypothetical protein
MTALVWALPALAVVAGWALRSRSIRRRLHAARTAAAQWEWIARRAQADRDHLAWELAQVKRLLTVAEQDRDASRWLAASWLRQVRALEARPPVIVGTVAVDGEAAYQAAVEGIDRVRAQAGVEG